MASVLVAALQDVAAKRSSMSSRRTKSSSSGRSNSGRNSQQQQHYAPAPAPKPAAPPKPVEAPKKVTNLESSAPAAPGMKQQPIGWNVGNKNPSAPVGPPPPYPGAGGSGHYYPGMGAAPPAYSPKSGHPPPYSSLNHGHHSPYQQQNIPMSHGMDSSRHYGLGPTNMGPSYGHNPYMSSGYGGHGGYGGFAGHGGSPYPMGGPTYYPGAGMGGFGGMAAAPMMGGGLYGGYQQPKSSLFSLRNILTGVALYGTYRSLTGGGWGGGGGYGSSYGYGGPREVHIYDHRDRGSNDDKAESIAIQQAIGVPVANVSYVAPSIPVTPTPLAPYPATGPAIGPATGQPVDPPAVPEEIPQENFEDYPPQPKIYFGYGFAYGYGEYGVKDPVTSTTSSEETKEQITDEATTPPKASTGSSEENKSDSTTEPSEHQTIAQESREESEDS
uniref:Putative polyu-specific endoribonuclease n=1 Tax=Nyssomyia neivai TaxID=330878 RepID=A0A1L8DXJ1_9DIPT